MLQTHTLLIHTPIHTTHTHIDTHPHTLHIHTLLIHTQTHTYTYHTYTHTLHTQFENTKKNTLTHIKKLCESVCSKGQAHGNSSRNSHAEIKEGVQKEDLGAATLGLLGASYGAAFPEML